MRLLVITLLSLTAILNIVLGFIILQRTANKPYGWLFAATLFAVAAWSVGDLMLLTVSDPNLINIAAKIFYIAPLFVPISIMLFSYIFPKPQKIYTYIWVVPGIVLGLWTLALLRDIGYIFSGVTYTAGINIPKVVMPGFLLYTLHFSIFFLITYAILYKNFKELKGIERAQVGYTFSGVIAASIFGMLTNLSLPALGDGQYVWLGPIFTIIFAVLATMSIAKHKLFDIRFFAVRAAAYGLTMTIVSLIYIAPILYIVDKLIPGREMSTGAFIGVLILMSAAAALYGNVRKLFDKSTSKLFFRDAYDPEKFIAELNQTVVSTLKVEELLSQATAVIARNLKTEYCVIGLNSAHLNQQRIIGTQRKNILEKDISYMRKHTPLLNKRIIVADFLESDNSDLYRVLQKNNISLLARLVRETEITAPALAYLYLGPKKNGVEFNSQDISILETIINGLIVAIQNALSFEEIQNFNTTLQQQVEDRTRELQKTNAKLVALDETKDDFISMASHQLRTPLTAVKGYLSMVLEGDSGKISPLQKKMLNQAYMSSQHMVYLISDLLNVSRLRTGKFVIERTPLNLAHLIDEEIGQLKETAKSRSLKLIYDKPKDFPTLMLDETKTRQVVMNFIDNALHYTPSGGHVTVELLDKPQTVELLVRDDGIGVPKSEQPHLFTKFYRAVNARRERPDGTGLGLFMAKKVVIAQGGAVVFESKENQGSTFGFTLPKAKLAVPSAK